MRRLERARARLRSAYLRSVPSKIEALQTAERALLASNAEADKRVRQLAHQLRGSGASYGFDEITEAAGLVEDASDVSTLRGRLRALIELLARVGAQQPEQTHILAVEDDQSFVGLLRAATDSPGLTLHAVDSCEAARAALRETHYSLVIVDLGLPDVDGRELVAELRRGASTDAIPVVVITAKGGLDTARECHALGADQFFEKPVDLELLSSALHNLLARYRSLSRDARLDALTGLFNRRGFEDAFERARSLAQRTAQSMTLAMIDIDHFKNVNDSYGHDVGDEVLRTIAKLLTTRMRRCDVSARWGGEEFVVLLPNTRPSGALTSLVKIQDALRAHAFEADGQHFHVSFSGGIAEVGEADTLDSALHHADRLLYVAKRSGRDRLLHEGSSLLARQPHVLLAEDDRDIAEQVRTLLEYEGFRVDVIVTADQALSAAAGRGYDLMIIDRLMPGGDGFDVLAKLRSNGPNRETPAVMLTVVDDEHEIEAAFEKGFDDYLTKPYRDRELVARVKRLLRS